MKGTYPILYTVCGNRKVDMGIKNRAKIINLVSHTFINMQYPDIKKIENIRIHFNKRIKNILSK